MISLKWVCKRYSPLSTRMFSTAQKENSVQYSQFMNQFFKDQEIQSRGDIEMQSLIAILGQKKLDYKERFERSRRMQEGKLSEKEMEEMKKEEQVIMEKVKQAEQSKVYVNFFNKPALRLISKTPSEILSELAIRVFTGSRDVPKDDAKAVQLFKFSEDNAKEEKDHLQVQYYKLLLRKFRLHQITVLRDASKKGVYSAYFYLGLMHLEGIHVSKDPERALDFYIKGAAKNNAYCFFELSRLYAEGQVVERDHKLQYLYLKRSAEEGFVTAQHLLGIALHEGNFTKKNDYLALAWFREAIRNGSVVSYLNAGDLLYEGGVGLKRNRLFALANYLGAYQNGAVFLKHRLEQVISELKEIEGEKLPEFRFLDIPPEYGMNQQV